MHRTIDPLDHLRKNFQKGKSIVREGDNLLFEDGVKLPLNTPTALTAKPTSGKSRHYTLGVLWLFLKNSRETLIDYMKETQRQQLESVEVADREKILDFFIKDDDNVDILDNTIRPKTIITLGKKKKPENLDLFYKDKNKNPEENKKKEKYLYMLKQQELKDPSLSVMDYIYSHEKKSLNRNSLMKPPENSLSFEHLLNMTKKLFTSEKGLKEQEEAKSFLDELIQNNEGLGISKLIIIVPSDFSEGNLCEKNAKAFLYNGRYINLNSIESEEENELIIEDNSDNNFSYRIQGKDLNFEICSNVRRFKKNDWKRVVAVFVQGDDWEFKDWPKNETVSTILQKVKGYFLKYEDTPTNKNVKNWNVQILEISRNKRHFDVSIQNKFWSSLSEFLSAPRKR